MQAEHDEVERLRAGIRQAVGRLRGAPDAFVRTAVNDLEALLP